MGIWDKLFGKTNTKKSEKSPYLPNNEDPLDLGFAKNFTKSGGRFLYNENETDLLRNFKEICLENEWKPQDVLCLNETNSKKFECSFVAQNTGNLKTFKAALIECEFLISNTGKILLSEHQIKHFKLPDFPEIIIVVSSISQLVRDVSRGMTLLKNKYPNTIPTNITTLKMKSNSKEEEKPANESSTVSKSIYLLLEDK